MQVIKNQNADEYNELLNELQTLRNAFNELLLKYMQLQQRVTQMQEVITTISSQCTQDALEVCKNAGTITDLEAGLVDGLSSA